MSETTKERAERVSLKQVRLVLFFTENMSILSWDKSGLLDREVAIYRALQPHLGGITFVTYGDKRDLAFSTRLPGIEILYNYWRLSPTWYGRWLALTAQSLRRGQVIYKSNQMRGSELPLWLSRLFSKPFLSRCGFSFSFTMRKREGEKAESTQKALALEKKAYSRASHIVVTTPQIKSLVIEEHAIDAEKISVIPNYVDTELFCPKPVTPTPGNRLIFIGRLESEKNLFNLIEAVKCLNLELRIVGDGNLREKLEHHAKELGSNVRFLGVKPHVELPKLLNASTAFILPSLYEGHPKTLLEAMSCGLPCIGSDIPSIRGVIEPGKNGLLCGIRPEEIRKMVEVLFNDTALQAKLGQSARQYSLNNLTIDKTVERELAVLRKIIHRSSRAATTLSSSTDRSSPDIS
ncbi:MAG: glycosyltransferase family 4 protein [Magnetococcales bacterium]|nr:glycosyltransferase family 4 protein [Magnetococcales bacterium]